MTAMNLFVIFAVSAVVLFVATVAWHVFAVRSIFGNVSKMDLNKLNSHKLHSIGFEKFYVTIGLWISTIVCAISSIISLVIHLVG
jgi:hypothetical protein